MLLAIGFSILGAILPIFYINIITAHSIHQKLKLLTGKQVIEYVRFNN